MTSLYLSEYSLWKVSYKNLFEATNGFSPTNLDNVGSFGSLYKGVVDERIVAIKVFNLMHQGASKCFISECMALRNIKHRNLVKVLTACSSVDYNGNNFKALVYEFMLNGSLNKWLHPNTEVDLPSESPCNLNFLQRVNIITNVAYVLSYLHNQCQSRIVHCNLKPSNILIDEEMIGHVGDFGLAKILTNAVHNLSTNDTSSMGFRGSIGYIPPEYSMGCEVSTHGDVYSFGKELEMFTRKHPTNELFKDDMNLHSFVKGALLDHVSKILDPNLLSEVKEVTNKRIMKCLVVILEVGVTCCSALPTERITINDALAKLKFIKDTLARP